MGRNVCWCMPVCQRQRWPPRLLLSASLYMRNVCAVRNLCVSRSRREEEPGFAGRQRISRQRRRGRNVPVDFEVPLDHVRGNAEGTGEEPVRTLPPFLHLTTGLCSGTDFAIARLQRAAGWLQTHDGKVLIAGVPCN